MDIVSEIIKQGGLGILAATFLWVWLMERKDHAKTRADKDVLQKEKDAMAEARRLDAIASKDQAYEILSGNATALNLIGAKIETVQTTPRRRR